MMYCITKMVDKITVYLLIIVIWSCLGVYLMSGYYDNSLDNNIFFYSFLADLIEFSLKKPQTIPYS